MNSIEILGFSKRGHHAENEDAYQTQTHPTDLQCVVGALADGQGGQPGGREAAQIAARTAVRSICSHQPVELASPFQWESFLREADLAVSRDPDSGYTTLVALAVVSGFVIGASCGDSAALALVDSDHRVLTENQRKNPPVGSGGASWTAFSYPLDQPWKILMMSDGVWKTMGWPAVFEMASAHSGHRLIDELRDIRQRRSEIFLDDFTVVLIEGGPRRG